MSCNDITLHNTHTYYIVYRLRHTFKWAPFLPKTKILNDQNSKNSIFFSFLDLKLINDVSTTESVEQIRPFKSMFSKCLAILSRSLYNVSEKQQPF